MKQQVICDLTAEIKKLTAKLNKIESDINHLINTIQPNKATCNELHRIKNLLKFIVKQAKA